MTQEAIDADPVRWKELRRTGVTASEIASVMGLAPATQSSAWKVFAAKTTGAHFDADTDATMRGTHLEPYVADRFAADYAGLTITPGGLYSSDARPWQMATFDRLARRGPSPEFPVQIKTSATADEWGDPGTADIPVHYRAQCLYEMDVDDADEILVPCLFIATWKVRVYKIERTSAVQSDIEYMREAAEEFLSRVQRDDPPPMDWTPATTAALKTLYAGEPGGEVAIPVKLARRYRDARIAKATADRRLGQAVNEILALAGNARVVTAGKRGRYRRDDTRVATRTRGPRRSYDTEMLRVRYPDAAAATERVTDVTTLRPAKWAKARTEGTDVA